MVRQKINVEKLSVIVFYESDFLFVEFLCLFMTHKLCMEILGSKIQVETESLTFGLNI